MQRAAREEGSGVAVRSEGGSSRLAVETHIPAATGSEANPSLSGEGGEDAFNPESIVNDLRRAINQSERTLAGIEPADTFWGSVKYKWHRNIDFDAVFKALDDLGAMQIAIVRSLYLAREKRTLDYDLFEGGESGYPSSLTVTQRARLQVLLRGTRGEAVRPETSAWLLVFKPETAARLQSMLADAKLPADRLNRLERAALEIVAILSGHLNDSKRERLMALHRRPVSEIAIIDVFYESHTGLDLPTELAGKLDGLQYSRMMQLRNGNTALADAFAIEYLRRAIEKIDAERPATSQYGFVASYVAEERAKRHQALVDRIDDVIALNRQEALAQTSMSASQAVAARLQEVLSQGRSAEGKNLGEVLAATLGAKKGAELTATASGALIEAHARRLAETESRKATTADQLATTLRALRELAETDLVARAADPWLASAEKEKLLADTNRAVNEMAVSYVAKFKESYEAIRGEGRPYADIVSAFSGVDEDTLRRLEAGAGTMRDEEELDLAIRRNKPDLVIAILRRQPTQEAIDSLTARYYGISSKSIQEAMFGYRLDHVVATGEEASSPDRSSIVSGIVGGVASGRNAALVSEQLEKPAAKDRGGVVEMEWVAASAEREFEVTWANRGVTGRLREIGDDPETETIMRESIKQIRVLEMRWLTSIDRDERRRVLTEMKRWRATLSGDAAAYEADNAKMRDTIRSAVSIAVQLALAVALPGAGATFMGFVRVTAMNIAASVASNVVIYGDDYSLDRLQTDIAGGVLGAAGGKLGEELVGIGLAAKEARAAAAEIADRIAKPVADATASAAAKVGIGTTIAKEAASQLGSTAGQSLATGENQFTVENLFQSVWMSGAGKLGKKVFGLDTPRSHAKAPRGEEVVPAGAKPASTSAVPVAPAAETALPGSVPLAPGARLALPAAGWAEVATPPGSRPAATPANAPVLQPAAASGETAHPTPGGAGGRGPAGEPPGPQLPRDFVEPDEFTFTTEGPPVAIPVNPSGSPAHVLEIGAGPTDTNLGLPAESGQGSQAMHEASLVNVTRTDVRARPGAAELNAQQPIPPEFWGQDAVIINNPRGYRVDIANVGQAVRPGGRIVIQGRAEVVPGMRGINPDMNPILQQVLRGDLPPGYRVVDVVVLPEVRGGDPTAVPKPPEIMGGPFQQTTGGPVGWPNTRIVIERIVPVNEPVAKPGSAWEETGSEPVSPLNAPIESSDVTAVGPGTEGVFVEPAKAGSVNETRAKFSPEERRIADVLASEGKTVEATPRSNAEGVRTGDAMVDGRPGEFKTMDPGADSATVRNEVNNSIKRGGQARDMILDARGSGLSEAEAIRGLNRVGGITRGKIDSVRIIGDGYDIKRNYP
jgi:hypothetical protein